MANKKRIIPTEKELLAKLDKALDKKKIKKIAETGGLLGLSTNERHEFLRWCYDVSTSPYARLFFMEFINDHLWKIALESKDHEATLCLRSKIEEIIDVEAKFKMYSEQFKDTVTPVEDATPGTAFEPVRAI